MNGGPLSPCVGLCVLDPPSGLCAGCARSGAEIGAWRDAPEAFRAQVWAEMSARAPRLGLAAWLLPWGPAEIRAAVVRMLAAGGACDLGFGAAGTFRGGAAGIVEAGETLTAIAPGAGLRLRISPWVRAFGRAGGEVTLGLPQVRLRPPAPLAGPDAEALSPGGTALSRVVVGSAGPEGRLTLRGAAPGRPAEGTWVVETALGRVESPGDRPWTGPGLPDLPAAYAAAATLRP